jgi:hypothetical protein
MLSDDEKRQLLEELDSLDVSHTEINQKVIELSTTQNDVEQSIDNIEDEL